MTYESHGVVQAGEKSYKVDLELQTCDCGRFQENGIPCGHPFSCILTLGKWPQEYVPDFFTVQTW